MWVEFVTRASVIEVDRTARYFTPGTRLDIEPELAGRFVAEGSAIETAGPMAPTYDDPFIPPSLGNDILTVACVCRGGEFYDVHKYVAPLARGVARHLTRPYRFVCFTDAATVPEGVERVPLLHNWPGFWSKIELYRPGIMSGPVMYLDLDTVICGSLDALADAVAAHSLLCSTDMAHGWINSSFVGWTVDLSHIYEAMASDPVATMARYDGSGPLWGDQGLMQDLLAERRIPWQWVQDVAPGVVAWQPIPLRGKPAAKDVAVSMWYGHPKPHEVRSKWMARHWV